MRRARTRSNGSPRPRRTSRSALGSAAPRVRPGARRDDPPQCRRLLHPLERRDVPSMKRVTSQPSGSTKATTSGPDARRRQPRWSPRARPGGRCRAASVSCPAIRSTHTSPPSSSTLRLWFVIPPPRISQRASPIGPDARHRAREPSLRSRANPLAIGVEQRLEGDLSPDPVAEDLDLDLRADVVLARVGTHRRSSGRRCSRSRRS